MDAYTSVKPDVSVSEYRYPCRKFGIQAFMEGKSAEVSMIVPRAVSAGFLL